MGGDDTDTIAEWLGWAGNGTALVLFLSPIPTMRRHYAVKSTESYNGNVYLITWANCIFWALYCLPFVTEDRLQPLAINILGLLIQGSYIAIYYHYKGPGRASYIAKFAMIITIAAIVSIPAFVTGQGTEIFGPVAIFFNTFTYAAPLDIMYTVIRTRSVQYMPFLISAAVLVNSVVWVFYSLLIEDVFILIPNGCGAVLGKGEGEEEEQEEKGEEEEEFRLIVFPSSSSGALQVGLYCFYTDAWGFKIADKVLGESKMIPSRRTSDNYSSDSDNETSLVTGKKVPPFETA